MGNCFALHNQHHHHHRRKGVEAEENSYVGVGYRYDRDSDENNSNNNNNNKELRDPFSIEKLDPTENETSSSDTTAPMSPDSVTQLSPASAAGGSLLSLSSLASTSTDLVVRDGGGVSKNPNHDSASRPLPTAEGSDEAQDVVAPLFSAHHYSRALVPCSSPRHKGRALQARLQKARYLQLALTAPSSSSSLLQLQQQQPLPLPPPPPVQQLHRLGDPRSSHSSRSSLASSSESSAGGASFSGDDDEDGEESWTDRATFAWAELELDSPVLCTAMSRTTTTTTSSSSSSPLSPKQHPLHIAVGTESGSVVVQELLSQPPQPPPTNPGIGLNNNSSSGSNDVLPGYTVPGMTTTTTSAVSKLGRPVSVPLHGRVRALDFSPNGLYLVAGGDDCQCHIYQFSYEPYSDENVNARITRLRWVADLERVDRVYAVKFSPDSRYLAVGGFDGTVAIFAVSDFTTNEVPPEAIAEIPRDGLILTVDWSPDNRYLAIGGSDRCCAIVDCHQSWRVFREIRRATTIQAIKWYPTGKYLAVASADTVAIVAGRDSFVLMHEIVLRKTNGSRDHAVYKNNSICWSPNGTYFAVSGLDRTCTLYETHRFTVVHRIPRIGNITSVVWGQQQQHQNASAGAVMLPPRFLAIGGEDGKVVIMKAGLEANIASSGSSMGGDDFSSTAGSSYFSTRSDWVLKENTFRDFDDSVDLSSDGPVNVGNVGGAPVVTVAFSRGSKSRPSVFFAHSTDDGLVTVRYCADWKVLAEIQFPKPVETMMFSNGGRFLALGCADSNIYISDTAAKWELVAKIEFAAPISAVHFGGKNNERLIVGSVDGTLAFLDPRKGFDFTGELEANTSPVVSVDWTSRNLAIGREDGSVAIHETSQVLDDSYVSATNLERDSAVRAVSFGVSSRFLAVGDAAGRVAIYSSKGGWVICHQVEVGRCLNSVLWCPLGRHLAFVSNNGAMKVIDTIFWAEVVEAESASPPCDSGNLIRSSLAYSQDGRQLAFSRSDRGLGILDASAQWNLAFNLLLTAQQSEVESDPERGPSSISSHQGEEEDDDGDCGPYEV